MEKIKQLDNWQNERQAFSTITSNYGETVAIMNLVLYLLTDNKKKTFELQSILFVAEDFLQLTPSQSSTRLVETKHSQVMIIVYSRKGDTAEFALQLSGTQIFCKFTLPQMLALVIKSTYLFDLEYESRLHNFFCFWEKILNFGALKNKRVGTVDQLLRNVI